MKKIDIHKDYTLFNLMVIMNDTMTATHSYMQDQTPFGEAYLKAVNQFKRVHNALKKLESCLAECQEVENYGKKNN